MAEVARKDRHIRVGTAGWSYEDWQGIVYPQHPKPRDELVYLAGYFDTLEVNSSFYRPPTPQTTESWVKRTLSLEGFRFTFKIHQRFTHQRDRLWTPEEAATMRRGLAPAADAGRLGALLLQFPWSFKADPGSIDWLKRLAEEFRGFSLVAELRHDSWTQEEGRRVLNDLRLTVANIDQPLLSHCIGPTANAHGALGYVRLHGRNREAWFAEDAGRNERYNYLYSEEEIAEWVARIKKIAESTREVYVVTNNHYRGQAAANALQIMAGVLEESVPVPPPLVKTYPFLEKIASADGARGEEQGSLF